MQPVFRFIAIHPQPEIGDENLLDLAALHTLINGGTVYAGEPGSVPDDQPLAAVLRY
ncbi:hypothetical protein [Leptolyngbya ohadii]|uniref:hypothetical protein n=1 Tax=Leptolyngbya ohadii TaxID=1962290 RepID=UPI0019D47927|nr:hypothetical protein [Leptolyngbya ohadii]